MTYFFYKFSQSILRNAILIPIISEWFKGHISQLCDFEPIKNVHLYFAFSSWDGMVTFLLVTVSMQFLLKLAP